MPINIGIIGAGRIGKVHADALSTRIIDANVVAIADVYLDSAQAVAERYRIPHATDDYTAILNDDSIDAVVICSSTDTHSQFIAEAAQAGKHIFCEKPIDFDLARIDATLDAVKQAEVKFQVGFNRRFDANHVRLKQAITSGEIGTPRLLHIISRDPSPPPIEYIKVSGGMFLDMTIHDFDMARFLIGAEVEEIYACAGVMVDEAIGQAGDVDTAIITLKFANGVMGTIDNSREASYGYDQRVEVFGSKGSARTENRHENRVVISDGNSVHHDKPLHFFMERYMDSYVQEMVAFVDCVMNDKPVPATGLDGRIPVVMGLAARKSYDENRPVKLSEIG